MIYFDINNNASSYQQTRQSADDYIERNSKIWYKSEMKSTLTFGC